MLSCIHEYGHLQKIFQGHHGQTFHLTAIFPANSIFPISFPLLAFPSTSGRDMISKWDGTQSSYQSDSSDIFCSFFSICDFQSRD